MSRTIVSYTKEKKTIQLGMNPSTAQQRLVKDLLWHYINKNGHAHCCHCGEEMSRNNFSIEHLIPWMDSDDPVSLFFDLSNIGFSHLHCNTKKARKNKKYTDIRHKWRVNAKTKYDNTPDDVRKKNRREKYLRTGN